MNVSFPLSLTLSHLTLSLSLLPALSSLWIPTCNERAGSTNPGWRDTATLGIYYLKPVVQRPSLFSRAPRVRACSWLSFFPISPARCHHAVTDDVPLYRDGFFAVDVLSRVTLVSPSTERVRVALYASVLSRVRYHYLRNMNNKKLYYIITHFSHRCRMTQFRESARHISYIYVWNIQVPLRSNATFMWLRGLFSHLSSINCRYTYSSVNDSFILLSC